MQLAVLLDKSQIWATSQLLIALFTNPGQTNE